MRRPAPGSRLVVATHNPGKLAEIAALLQGWQVELVSAGALGLPEPVEDAADFAGNARIKAQAAAAASGLPALSDDSGFCVAALGGAPGIHSARWAGPARDWAAAMARVAGEAQAAYPADRRAWFVCALCLALPDEMPLVWEGRVDGSYAWPPRGKGGFGYDPIFVPDGSARSYGEMSTAEKERDSHRARAFAALVRDLPP